jgi:lysyl-tRNA synthetase class 2
MEERKKKLEEIIKAGVNPYAHKFNRSHTIKEIIDKHSKIETGTKLVNQSVSIAGRVRSIRKHGKLIFSHIDDYSGRIQVCLEYGTIGKKLFDFLDNVNTGDFIGIHGYIVKTMKGELSVWANKMEFLTKSLRSIPAEWYGLKDIELRYRQRYVDLIMNPSVRDIFFRRHGTIEAIREFLKGRGFIEVETPILQPVYGGASARPFESYLHSLGMKVYMRISNEMYLKRLIVGGYEKVFEFSQDFRNEGIDKTHNPEFMQMETMCAYADYKDSMDITENMVEYVAKKVLGKTKLVYQGKTIDLKTPWRRMTMLQSIKKYTGEDLSKKDVEGVRKIAKKLNVEVDKNMTWGEIVATVFEERVEEHLIQPVHIYDLPADVSGLAKRKDDDERLAERFETFVNTWELVNSYSEGNDPKLMRDYWLNDEKKLKKGDFDAQKMDEDFIRALEYGMPPTSGIGLGIDRLVMLLTNSQTIRDVIFFPFMRPENESVKRSDKK